MVTSPERNSERNGSSSYKDDDDDYNDRKMRSPKEDRDSRDSTVSGGGGSSNTTNEGGCTVHVSNLNHKTRETELHEKFSQYGKIQECIILVDPNTKASRGFGFITFSKPEEADEAITGADNSKLEGSQIRVEKAKRSKPRDPTPGFYMGSDRSKRRGGGGGGYPYPGRERQAPYPYPYPPAYPPTSKYPIPYGYYNYGAYPPPTYPPTYSSYPPHKPYDNRYSPYSVGGSGRDRGRGGGGGDDRDSRRHDDRDSRRGSSHSSHGSDDREYFRRDSHH